MGKKHLDSKLSDHVHIIDVWFQDKVMDSKKNYSYAVQLKSGKWIWIKDGQTSDSLYQQKYETLEETIEIYNLIYYGDK